MEYKVELPQKLVNDAQRYIEDSNTVLAKLTSLSGLKVNDRVEHHIMGKGTIIEIDETKHIYSVQFDGVPTVRNLSFKTTLKKI